MERWWHIARRHPELVDQRERVLETVAEPERIQEGDDGALMAVRRYPDTPLGAKHLVVIYWELNLEDGFILTAYFTTELSTQRRTLWKR